MQTSRPPNTFGCQYNSHSKICIYYFNIEGKLKIAILFFSFLLLSFNDLHGNILVWVHTDVMCMPNTLTSRFKVLLPSVDICTYQIPIECMSHPSNVHHVYI